MPLSHLGGEQVGAWKEQLLLKERNDLSTSAVWLIYIFNSFYSTNIRLSNERNRTAKEN